MYISENVDCMKSLEPFFSLRLAQLLAYKISPYGHYEIVHLCTYVLGPYVLYLECNFLANFNKTFLVSSFNGQQFNYFLFLDLFVTPFKV
jgi:hypothetical protein